MREKELRQLTDYQLLERLVPDLDLRLQREPELTDEIERRVRTGIGFTPFEFWKGDR